MQLVHKVHEKSLKRTQFPTHCFSKVSSPFQSHLLLLLYSSDTLWQLPRLQSPHLNSYIDKGLQEQGAANQKTEKGHRSTESKDCCKTNLCISCPRSNEQSYLLAACDTVPLTPSHRAGGRCKGCPPPAVTPFPWAQHIIARLTECGGKDPILLTRLLGSSGPALNCSLHYDISVSASYTSDSKGYPNGSN